MQRRTAGLSRPRVFCEEWGKPLIASQPWVAELVEAAGGTFIGTPGAQIDPSTVSQAAPDVLIAAWCGAGDRVPLEKVAGSRGWQDLPAVKAGERKAVQLSAADLDGYVGRYAAKIQPVLVFQRAGGNLSVDVGGNAVTLYPMSATTFFMKERDIVVEFQPAANGKSPGFLVLENGAPVDEGVRQ